MSQPPVKTKPPIKAAPPARQIVSPLLRQVAERSGLLDPRLMEQWPALVGPELAKLCFPVRLKRQGRTEALVVAVKTGAAAMRIQYAQQQILGSVRQCLGRPTLKRLIIDQKGTGPKTPQAGRPGAKRRASRWASVPLTAADAAPVLVAATPSLPPATSPAEALGRLKEALKKE